MPGRKLNDTERRLANWWEKGRGNPYPILDGISIKGDKGLRGLSNIDVKFQYPLTVICGKNGCGKSTILALAALAFHSPEGHFSVNALRKPKKKEKYNYYTAKDFFYQGPSDPDITGIELNWVYFGEKGEVSRNINKRSEKWMHYERRPQRPVHFLGVVRSVPAIEQTVLRGHFTSQKKQKNAIKLTDENLNRLSDIMSRRYTVADEVKSSKYSLRRVSAYSSYSSFNMGSGEDNLVTLLLLLQHTPPGSLIVIEEIDLGLHPEALKKLARHLLEITLAKKLQVIVSSHSQDFIDSVPRQARILLQRSGNSSMISLSPTTRFAIGTMSGVNQPELYIYCEDTFSAEMINVAIRPEVRRRVKTIPVGSDSELCRQIVFHNTVANPAKALVVWDGDVVETDIIEWSRNCRLCDENGNLAYHYFKLPGGNPEQWVLDQLSTDEGIERFSKEFNTTELSSKELISILLALPDKHDAVYHISQYLAIPIEVALASLIKAVSSLSTNPLEQVSINIVSVLDGTPSSFNQVACT